jgi:hypothetical protein
MQATERLRLPLKFIGYCEVDQEVSTELEALFPGIPNHGDVRNVIAALEAGELILKPDVVEMWKCHHPARGGALRAAWRNGVRNSTLTMTSGYYSLNLFHFCNPG